MSASVTLPVCNTPAAMAQLKDLDLFLLRGKLAIRVDRRTALYLADTDAAVERKGFGLAFECGTDRWWAQGLHWTVRGDRRSYWPALIKLYRHIRRTAACPQSLGSLAGRYKAKAPIFAWGTVEHRKQMDSRRRHDALEQFEKWCQDELDHRVPSAIPMGWCVHRLDSSGQRCLIAKRQVGEKAVETTIQWFGQWMRVSLLCARVQPGYDPNDPYDRMRLRQRRLLMQTSVHAGHSWETEASPDSGRLVSFSSAAQAALAQAQELALVELFGEHKQAA